MSNTKRIMEQAQAFASAWSLVGGAFDGGDGMERAEEEKAELQRMVEELETALNAIPSSDNTIDGLSQYVEKLESHLAALEKQKPVAWLDKSTEERPGDTVWLPCDLKGMDTSWLVPLYAAQPVTAPVRLTDEQLADAACNANSSFRAIESAVLRANGFKIDHPEHSLELVGLRGCNSRHGGKRNSEPCIYRMRTTDPGCTGCADRDEDQPGEAEESAAPTYSYSTDGETFYGQFATPEEAAADYLKDTPDCASIEIGQNARRTAHSYVGSNHIESLLEMVAENAYEECGDCAESWLSDLIKDADQLNELTQVIGDWIQRKEPPSFWHVDFIRRITRAELIASGHLDQPPKGRG